MPGGAFDEAAFWMVVGLNRVGTDAPDIHIGDDGYDGDDGDGDDNGDDDDDGDDDDNGDDDDDGGTNASDIDSSF